MTPQELRDYCLTLPGSVETFPFGFEISVFKAANGKIFALSSLDAEPLAVSLKCHPEDSLALRAQWSEVTPGYHLNKKHWITIDLTGAFPDELVENLIADSHALVKPRMRRAPRPE